MLMQAAQITRSSSTDPQIFDSLVASCGSSVPIVPVPVRRFLPVQLLLKLLMMMTMFLLMTIAAFQAPDVRRGVDSIP